MFVKKHIRREKYPMKIGLVQYDPVWEAKKENEKTLLNLLEKANDEFSLLIFPEMTLTGFTMRSHQFSENIDGETKEFFSQAAIKYNTDVLGGFIEKDDNEVYNSIMHLNKTGELVSKYRKIHPFSYSGEDKNYKRGNKAVITEIDNWKTGLSICYDLRFPELFRQYAKDKADLIVVIANWPVTRIAHWRALLKARSIENQCFVAGINRTGQDPANKYNGFSSLFNPMGEEILSVENKSGVFVCNIDLNETSVVRAKLPFLDDMILI